MLDGLINRMEKDEFDLIAVGRALLSDPSWVVKVREGKLDQLNTFDPSALAEASSKARGRLRVSLPLSGEILTSAMATFGRRYPAITLELDYSDRLVDVIDEGFDAVIRTGDLTDLRLLRRNLGQFRWLLAAAPSYLAEQGAPASPNDLSDHICLRQKFSNGRVAAWSFKEAPEKEPPVSLSASIIEPLVNIAVGGGGIGAFPQYLIKGRLAEGSLVSVLDSEMQATGTLNLLWPASR